jgi:hypothetical protein
MLAYRRLQADEFFAVDFTGFRSINSYCFLEIVRERLFTFIQQINMQRPTMTFKTITTLLCSLLLSGCGTTYNGVTLSEGRLKQTKRIVVVSLGGDTLTYLRQGVLKGDFRTMDVPSWNIDNVYADRFANEISTSFGVPAVAYYGPRHETLKQSIYATRPLLRRDRFDWKAAEQDLRAVAVETDADLIALVLREGYNDELSYGPVPVAGFGFTSGRGACAAFAHFTVMLVDAARIEPIAGANVFKRDSAGKILSNRRTLPIGVCRNGATELSPEQLQILRQTMLTIIDPNTIEQTTMRLLKYE